MSTVLPEPSETFAPLPAAYEMDRYGLDAPTSSSQGARPSESRATKPVTCCDPPDPAAPLDAAMQDAKAKYGGMPAWCGPRNKSESRGNKSVQRTKYAKG